MQCEPTALPGVLTIIPDVFRDARGYFLETWQQQKFSALGLQESFVQDNESGSAQFALRGLHYQIRQPQGKLVRVVAGEVFDVAVDMRRSSPYFGRSCAVHLSGDNKKQLWMPPGFAHGFFVLSDGAVFSYKCTTLYAPEFERTLLWSDPELRISWPIPSGVAPLISPKDQVGSSLRTAEAFP